MHRLLVISVICTFLMITDQTEAWTRRRRRRTVPPPPQDVYCPVNYNSPLNNTNSLCPAGTTIPENTRCEFSCPTGYNLVGNQSVYCMSDGLLSDEIGCEIITCPVWGYTWPLNGSCDSNSSVDWSTECRFECAEGYRLEGDDIARCGDDGQLNGSLPTCTIITCPVPNYNTPLNGSCDSNSSVDWSTECMFECAEGYLLEGDHATRCGDDGQFNGSLPSCTIITCPVWGYTWPLNGSCDSNSSVDWSTECRFECAEGYRLEGDDIARCGDDGQLNGSLPTCTIITCPVPNYNTPLNGSCDSNSSVDWSTECRFECAEGYLLEGDHATRCGDDGQFNGSLPSCTIITCPVWGYTWPLNGSCDSNSSVDWSTECRFDCAEGYCLEGDDIARCGDDGQLNGSLPTCTIITCSVPNYNTPLNGSCDSNSSVDWSTECRFECAEGYLLEGDHATRCGGDGQFNGSLPSCTIITCPVWGYTWPLNGSCDSNSSVDWSTECRFECAEGYCLEGDDIPRCGDDGQLNGSLPTCTIITCSVPNYNTPLNGSCDSNSSVDWSTECRFECAEGYLLEGDHATRCGDDGQFNESLPSCTIITCPVWEYTWPLNGSCDSNSSVDWSTECRFECAEGYFFEGSVTARCGLSGELNGSIPDCNILCEVDYMSPLTNINSACPAGTKITENTQCEFSCPTGYNLVGNSTVYCMANGLLSDEIGCESINKCSALPCSADANSFCVNRLGTFQCSCYEGYENSIENPQCSPGIPTIACQINSCMNGGTCNQEPTTFTCTCPSGFTGLMCQNDLRCNDVVCEDTQTCFQGACVCQDGRVPVNGVCERSCSQSCVLEQERCVLSSCRCRTTWYRREIGNGVSRCSKASRLLRISYILFAINGVQVNFEASYRDPQSAEYIAGAEAIRYVIPRVLKARGVGGVITSVVLGYFNGSLGVDSAVSVDETFVGDETTLTDALMQEMIEGQDHLTADNTSLRINMASLNVAASPPDPDETRKDIADGSINVALIAGLVPGLGIVLVVIFTCACVTFVRSQRQKNMAEMMFGDRPTSLNHYSRNVNDELSYRKESSQSDVYYLYPGSSGNSSIKTGYSHRSRNPVSTNRRSASSAIYNKTTPSIMGSPTYDYSGSDTNHSTTVNGQPKGERDTGFRRSTTSTIYNSIATIYE
ncbi:sushi, von Willebrand factor type A, EGF and pentraxin domain-containing protein 1-like isoform X4 [Lytechinus variegatus]|uniref:sushi, von Willebrand factor type A, EGF and pentraxin domain-containing protein 1-like isoform X4 n=1 Tax=Lytechinus variegatus TaxID=7654 RepID=UPI001BB1F3EF|nr:sushi, von Willebrand factor type A, EGF and pentraxin domain-containing protein 1-like isoform X4 [Lytechinus variegatus]